MQTIKVVFFDIDGTLLPLGSDRVPESTVESLRKLKEKGIYIVLSTGRDIEALSALPIHEIPFDAFLTLNGQLCLDREQKVIHSSYFDRDTLQILLQIFHAKKIPVVIKQRSKSYINFIDGQVLDTQDATNGEIPDLGEYESGKVYMLCAFINEKTRDILKNVLDDCKITSWHETGADIIPLGGGKEEGIEHYLEHYHLLPEESMAFGDGENDIGMLKTVGIGIAMGNSSPLVKAAADYVTDRCENDGVYKALVHFGVIE